MKIVFHYIGINLLKVICIVMLFLLGVDLFLYLINELQLLGIGNYNSFNLIVFVLLTIPRKLYINSPWSILMGSLIFLGDLAKHNELLFIRSIGLSKNQIAMGIMKYILIFTGLIFVLGEILAPKIELLAQKKKTLALSKGNAIYTISGTWIRNKNKFIQVGSISKDHVLQEIIIYELNNEFQIVKVSFAETAKLIDNKICNHKHTQCANLWELNNVRVIEFAQIYNHDVITSAVPSSISPKNIGSEQHAKFYAKDLLDFNILSASNVKHLERLSIQQLITVIKQRLANNLVVIEYKIAFWKKLIQPIVILSMGWLSILFIFGPLRNSSKGAYVVTGLILGVGFYLFSALLTPIIVVVTGIPVIAVALPPVIFFGVGILLSMRYDYY